MVSKHTLLSANPSTIPLTRNLKPLANH